MGMRVSLHTVALLTSVFLLASCQCGASLDSISPLSSPMSSSSVSAPGNVYVAQIHGAWASGAPYPVFFIEVPYGTTWIYVQNVTYSTQPPLKGTHPRLTKVSQSIVWPGGTTSQVFAQNFVYDENSGILLMFDAFLDNSALDTASYDLFSCPGVGIAYLGDVKGVNIFYNCATPTSINYQELNKNEAGQPTEALFNWKCEGNIYEVKVTMSWGKSDPLYSIDVITGLTATITRK